MYKWPDGKEYFGNFYKGKRNGLGKFIWNDGRVFIGFWNDGKQDGLGMYVNESKRKLFGVWSFGKRKKWLSEDEVERMKNEDDQKLKEILEFKGKEG